MNIYVAIYSHEYGNDVRAFRNSEGADKWRIEIARDYWTDAFPDDEPPANDETMAQQYWNLMNDNYGKNEYFEINVCNVED